jgi:hypothetical protein
MWEKYQGFEDMWHVSFENEDVSIDIALHPEVGRTVAEVIPQTCDDLDWLPSDAHAHLTRFAEELGMPTEVLISLGL